MKPFHWITLVVLVGGGIVTAYQSDVFGSPEDRFYERCADELKKRLKSPSSYKLIRRTRLDDAPATIAMLMGWKTPEEEAQARERALIDSSFQTLLQAHEALLKAGDLVQTEIIIQYEASNSYGAQIAGTASCTTTDFDRDFDKQESIGRPRVRINGMTHSEWLVEQLG